ncbi:hypothetical protein A9G34_01315 [Gilliamella sp. Choc4-2]|jgi:hypothetical protein|uniref:tail fiber/spike domain-containing protein n=1 Tax=Gilliamella sp. Choc4-2 TaxID=3120237 RepID=UPI00080DC5EE|nr:hypothetical protein [Gilliamella apicola]OCG45764.1 hypothetical protein A9G34_01315 [Gilliamella apicola]
MEHLKEETTWVNNIYLIQRTDRVGGGVRGIANKPHYELANRTQYLKKEVDAINISLNFTLSASENNSNFDAKGNRIENLKKPENKNDAVNKEYVDGNDEKLQKQVNELIEAKIGYESIGNFNDGCTINTRNEIVYDEQTKKYYAWAGNLPHHVLPETNVTDEMNNGKPWLVIENSNEFIAKIESIKQIAQSVATQFYGFKRDGAKLILETAENIDNKTLHTSEFLEWVIAPGGCEFTVNNKNLLMVI